MNEKQSQPVPHRCGFARQKNRTKTVYMHASLRLAEGERFELSKRFLVCLLSGEVA